MTDRSLGRGERSRTFGDGSGPFIATIAGFVAGGLKPRRRACEVGKLAPPIGEVKAMAVAEKAVGGAGEEELWGWAVSEETPGTQRVKPVLPHFR